MRLEAWTKYSLAHAENVFRLAHQYVKRGYNVEVFHEPSVVDLMVWNDEEIIFVDVKSPRTPRTPNEKRFIEKLPSRKVSYVTYRFRR